MFKPAILILSLFIGSNGFAIPTGTEIFKEVQVYNKDQKDSGLFDSSGFNKRLSHLSHLLNNQGKDLQHLFIRNLKLKWESMATIGSQVVVPFEVSVRWAKGSLSQGTMVGSGQMTFKKESSGKLSPDPQAIVIQSVRDSQSLEFFSRALYFDSASNDLESQSLKFLNRVVSLIIVDQIVKNPKMLQPKNDKLVQIRIPRYFYGSNAPKYTRNLL